MRELFKARKKSDAHPHAWLWEPFENDPSFELRTLFGTKAIAYDGRLALCCSAKEEPWRGVLVCTDRTHHASLMRDFSGLTPHPVLSKWLYLSESIDAFEETAMRLTKAVRNRDPRIGIHSRPKRRRTTLRYSDSDHP